MAHTLLVRAGTIKDSGLRPSGPACLPAHGLAFDRAPPADRDPLGHEVGPGYARLQSQDSERRLGSDDCQWLLRGALRRWRPVPALDVLVPLHGPFLHIVSELLFGLAAATQSETDPVIQGQIQAAPVMTVVK